MRESCKNISAAIVEEVERARVAPRLREQMVGLGLTAPFATQLLGSCRLLAQTAPHRYKPTKAGGGGALKLLFWQAPTLLNPHFAVGTKDAEGCRIFYEPLAALGP